MNSFTGRISDIQISGAISIISVEMDADILLKSIVVETPQTAKYLQIDNSIKVLFKETEVVLGKDMAHAISLQNRIKGTIVGIEKGVLISKIKIKSAIGCIESIISTNALETLQFKEGSKAVAMIKLNEIMLSE